MKKINNDFIFYSLILLGYIIFSILILNAYHLHLAKQAISSSCEYFPNVVIDAGHGGIDCGAVGLDNILEKDINLKIAKKLRDLLKISGFKTTMIRENDESIHNKEAKTIRSKKISDLKNRLKIINEKENNLLISIHQNKFEDKMYSGAQTFFSKNNSHSKELAQSIKSSIVNFLQKDNKREEKESPLGVFLLKNAKVPAVIVECGFLSNYEDMKKLSNDEYQAKMAFSIYCGFIEYWRKF